jgi:putative transcriptional regulator
MKNFLKLERARKNITQAELAELVGVSRQSVNAIETGRYNLSTVLALKMAQVFGKTVNEIFELEEEDWREGRL